MEPILGSGGLGIILRSAHLDTFKSRWSLKSHVVVCPPNVMLFLPKNFINQIEARMSVLLALMLLSEICFWCLGLGIL